MYKKNYIFEIVKEKAWQAKFTWIPVPDFSVNTAKFPLRQSYGVCFNNEGKILIMREDGINWKIPGGTIEKDETPEQALIREFMEEVTIELDENPILLGAQLSESLTNEKDKAYQLRYICRAKKILDPTPDPCTGLIYEMEWINPQEFTRYVKWGKIGDEIFKEAIKMAKKVWKLPINLD